MSYKAYDYSAIHWPKRYAPKNAPVYVRNSLWIEAPAEQIWAWLVRAPGWPDWYPNAKGVQFIDDGRPDLALDTVFRWQTFGVNIRSRVREFVPCSRVAWDGRALGIDVYHGWVIEASAGGCRVVTEETQHGVLARAGAWLMPKRMSNFHQIWLENLAEKAVRGKPPTD